MSFYKTSIPPLLGTQLGHKRMCQPKIIWDKSNRFLGLECDRKNYVGRSKYGPKSSLIVQTKLCRKLFCERNFKLIAMSHEQLFSNRLSRKRMSFWHGICRLVNKSIYPKDGPFLASFLLSSFADVWMWTVDLWCDWSTNWATITAL